MGDDARTAHGNYQQIQEFLTYAYERNGTLYVQGTHKAYVREQSGNYHLEANLEIKKPCEAVHCLFINFTHAN